ncbi:hypothetical protein CANCADRAFT_57302 [Tortispora caseinolytica NRRL Y-17796]|uniref:BRCT domain-containing protein n=1 Tax=Tortispora caseinolytica NRRL Y-17796 TaxID=767744 RepID=A0A1E4TGL9_9ASCO|nr:hypothetical protein CANCADRAFT_57302 [Tortispora caseinolytica NRRL Y-17796]
MDKELFVGTIAWFAPSIPADTKQSISDAIIDHGGKCSDTFDPIRVTHVVAQDPRFAEYNAALKNLLSVITPEWVESCLARGRLLPTRPFSPDPSHLFANVCVCVADLPPGDAEIIYGAVLGLGGQWAHSLTRFVTHVIANDPNDPKCILARNKPSIRIVTPLWVEDCLRIGRRVPDDAYLHDQSQKIDSESAKIPSSLPHIDADPEVTIPEFTNPPAKLFAGHTLYIDPDISLSAPYLESFTQLVQKCGGIVSKSLSAATIAVCLDRSTSTYTTAFQKGIILGNIQWVFDMIFKGEFLDPLKQLLHYPIPSKTQSIPKMQDLAICVSLYSGDARAYIEQLIRLVGAKYTKTLTPTNTHLIVPKAEGKKYAAARYWSLHVVNHLWIEESYAKWQMQSVSDPKYTQFLADGTLTQVVGQTQLKVADLAELISKPKESVIVEVDSDQEEDSAKENLQATTISNETEVRLQNRRSENSQELSIVPSTPRNPLEVVRDTVEQRSRSSRKSAQAATEKLHTAIEDLNEFQRHHSKLPKLPGEDTRKRKERAGTPSSKRSKNSPVADIQAIKILPTGFALDHLKEDDIEKLSKLGVMLVDDPSETTHVALEKIKRTEKFLVALAYGPKIVDRSYIEALLSQDTTLDPDDFLLKDKEGERQLLAGKTLLDVVKSAKDYCAKGGLFHKMGFNITPNTKAQGDVLKRIIEAHGGKCKFIKSARSKEYLVNNDQLVLIAGSSDGQFVEGANAYGKKHGYSVKAYTSEWVLSSIVRMDVTFDSEYRAD